MPDNPVPPEKEPNTPPLVGKPHPTSNKESAANAQPDSADTPSPADQAHGDLLQEAKIDKIESEVTNIQQAKRIITIENLNFNMGQVRELEHSIRRSKRSGWRLKHTANDGDDPLVSKYEHGILAAPPDSAIGTDSDDALAEKSGTRLPENLEDIRRWYCEQLSDIEKCFVQAVATLSGASVYEVRRATVALYKPQRDAKERLLALKHDTNVEGLALPDYPQIILNKEFLSKTYTEVREHEGRRLFWQDAQPNGFSPFAIRVLTTIEEETPIGGSTDLTFLDQLEQLPKQFAGESSWRIPRALGSLWFTSDKDQFFRIANTWVANKGPNGWWVWRTANLMFGAFEVEFMQQSAQSQQTTASEILDLLGDWIDESHFLWQTQSGINIGRTVAETCMLIAQKDLKRALMKLDNLLVYPVQGNGKRAIPDDVFIAIVLSYVMLARSGFAREVLHHLASQAKGCIYQRLLKREERRTSQQEYTEKTIRRIVTVNAILHAFTLLVLISTAPESASDEPQKRNTGRYSRSQALVEHPYILAEESKDVLLAGVLAAGETEWRKHITVLFGTMLIEENIDEAFYLMGVWAETVLRERSPETFKIREAYVQFMADVVLLADKWEQELKASGLKVRSTIMACTVILEDWQKESQNPPKPLGALATDVLRRIAARTITFSL